MKRFVAIFTVALIALTMFAPTAAFARGFHRGGHRYHYGGHWRHYGHGHALHGRDWAGIVGGLAVAGLTYSAIERSYRYSYPQQNTTVIVIEDGKVVRVE